MSTSDPATLADTYFRSWVARDEQGLRSVLAPDADFAGPLGTAEGVDACVAGLVGMARILDDVAVLHRWIDGDDVLTWFELRTTVAPPTPVANWMHLSGGRIARIRVTFDPREIVAA
ncbi:nuclear transport factor 2 family protein [Blastococcus sp. URHD0036]|uniref:nuclear transport factor 2 family protein n=1 Tax=Blastococcus sp. URHD0036 TaxID=1380356 RepID=UPI00049801BA|nr:nuclear transport factor 2 family protein [Blastococcus sp. URHD0036]